MVAGDEESYELFKDLFDPVISARHNGYAADAKHPTCLDVGLLSDTKIDPTGKYVITTRCRTGRSVRGFRLPPVTQFEERRKLENAIVTSLLATVFKITRTIFGENALFLTLKKKKYFVYYFTMTHSL